MLHSHRPTPLIGFAAYSGTGKTTLLTKLIPLLKKNKLRVGVIKHSHHAFDIDYPGKDSYRIRRAGASPVLLVSRFRRAIISEFESPREPCLHQQLTYFDNEDLDIILVEGFKKENFPKIELHRPSLEKPLLFPEDDSIIAIACDQKPLGSVSIPILDINEPEQICRFILERFIDHA